MTQTEIADLSRQVEFLHEIIRSLIEQLRYECQQRQELEQELRQTNQELCLQTQENMELFTAFNLEFERSQRLSSKAKNLAIKHNQLKAEFGELQAHYNDLGAEFVKFKACSTVKQVRKMAQSQELEVHGKIPSEHIEKSHEHIERFKKKLDK